MTATRVVIARKPRARPAGTKHFRAVALLLLLLAGCTPIDPLSPPRCLLPGQQPMIVAEMFFGRSVPRREPVSDAEWADFTGTVIARHFPEGFTVLDGDGQWQNPATGRISRERTKILLVAAKRAPDLAARLSAVTDAYKTRFNQLSVGAITRDSCASF